MRIAAGGYVVLIIFGVGLLAFSALSAQFAHWWMFPLSRLETVAAAGLLAAPAALALIWDRLSSVKIAGVEVSLTEARPPTATQLQDQIRDTARYQIGGSALPDIKRAVGRAAGALVELNLGDGESWWSTRLYLFSALAEDYTGLRQIVFVERCGPPRPCFVGMASPAVVRRALAVTMHADLDQMYRYARALAVNNILRRHNLLPAPRQGQRSWREFVRQHADQILAVDFFTIETV